MIEQIGYYTLLSTNPQVIQGDYYTILNDPLYSRDYTQNIVTMDSSIYKENKPYTPNPPMFDPGSAVYVHKRKLAAKVISSIQVEPRRPKKNKRSNVTMEDRPMKASEAILDDQTPRIVADQPGQGRKRPIINKIRKMKRKLPGQQLKARLIKGRKAPSTFQKRTFIKDLLKRAHRRAIAV